MTGESVRGSFATALTVKLGCGIDSDGIVVPSLLTPHSSPLCLPLHAAASGSAVMSQFVKAFRELSYAYSFIAECVSVR